MSDVELQLTPEELALLESDGDTANSEPTQVVELPAEAAPKKRAPRKPKETEAAATPDEEPAGDELPPEREPDAGNGGGDPDPVSEPRIAGKAPERDNNHALPAQQTYENGDPWGQLPAQMRHDNEGRPAF